MQKPAKTVKKRFDVLVQEQYPALTLNQIQSFILQGKIFVDGERVTKAGSPIATTATIVLTEQEQKYVSRAGLKLEGALQHFGIDVTGLTALDAGISTGGFTDCLLQNEVKRVYGIDVGHGQVHEKIRADKRAVLLEKTNLRLLTKLPELVDLATLDLSFISLLSVMPAVSQLLKPSSNIIALIKPQFEADRVDVGPGGLVQDAAVHDKVIKKIVDGMAEFGFNLIGVIDSPILGAASGNKEFLAFFQRKK